MLKGIRDHLIGLFIVQMRNLRPREGCNLPKVTQLITDITIH